MTSAGQPHRVASRTVYDKSELTYVSAELAFYNKLFDQSDWEAISNPYCEGIRA
jgi:hypothetical protein